jgi:hypothetical protein
MKLCFTRQKLIFMNKYIQAGLTQINGPSKQANFLMIPNLLKDFINQLSYILFVQRYFLHKIFPYRFLIFILNRIKNKKIKHSMRLFYYVLSMNKAVIDRFFIYSADWKNR